MMKFRYFTFALCFLLPLVSQVHAQENSFSITQAPSLDFSDGQSGPGVIITAGSIFAGATFFVSTPDLATVDVTIADIGLLFDVSPGDFVSNDTLSSFTPLAGNTAPNVNNLPSIPFGESFIGFAAGPGFISEVGYAQILRTPDTLELLDFDSVFLTFDPSSGITVPTPEPSSALLGAIGLIAMGLGRRRS